VGPATSARLISSAKKLIDRAAFALLRENREREAKRGSKPCGPVTSLREKLIKTDAKVVSHGRYITFQLAEIAVPRGMFAEILSLIARVRAPPAPA
jgi:hypothetical protein